MAPNVRTIEVDAATAEVLEARAAERGVSVAELVANLAAWDTQTWRGDRDGSRAAAEEASDLEELDRRWAAVQAGEPTVGQEEVVRWLDTWGTPGFRPWAER